MQMDLNELTPSEIDFEMGRRAASLRENADPRVYLNLKPGRKKLVKMFMIVPKHDERKSKKRKIVQPQNVFRESFMTAPNQLPGKPNKR